jgi:tRNA pseudouridine55 synthase
MEGVINVFKEATWSSGDVVNKLKGVLHERRIGHGGTLDPDATGVLPILTGKATRLFDYVTVFNKTYVARVRFGEITDTQDASGTILETRPVAIENTDISNALPHFTGTILQKPPMYSALHVNGQRLYELARRGETAQIPAREIKIYSIELVEALSENECTIRVTCGKGTYIRTLCHDLGEFLGCGAHMKTLLREECAGLNVKNAYKISELEEMMKNGDTSFLLPIDSAITYLPRVNIHSSATKKLENGNPIDLKYADIDAEGFVRIYSNDVFFGIGEKKNDMYYIKCMLGGIK